MDGTSVFGHTVVDALDTYFQVPKREIEKPLRMPVTQVLQMPIGIIITGRLEQGTLKPGDNVVFLPSGIQGLAFSLEMHNKQLEAAYSGDNIGINVKKLEKNRLPKTGELMVLASEKNLYESYEFTAQIVVQDHPGDLKASEDGRGGWSPNVLVRTAHAPCKMVSINWRQGKETNKTKVEGGDLCKYVRQGDAAEVVFRPQKPLFVEPYTACEGLGRICIMDSNRLVALGKITKVTPLTPELKEKLAREARETADAKRANQKKK